MPKILLKISSDPIEFEAPTAEAFLEAWKGVFPWEYDNDNTFMRMAARSACDWSGKPIRFDNISSFTADMIDVGMLEEVGEEEQVQLEAVYQEMDNKVVLEVQE